MTDKIETLREFHEKVTDKAHKEKINYDELMDYVDRRVYKIKQEREEITSLREPAKKCFTFEDLANIYKELKVHKKYKSTVNFLAYISNMVGGDVK